MEYLIHKVKAKTLIATHYHELIELEKQFNSVKNFSVSVYENDKEVVFLKKIVAGGANKSYGLDVAKIAGIPLEIIDNAKNHLQIFEQKNSQETLKKNLKSENNFFEENPEISKEKKEETWPELTLFGEIQVSDSFIEDSKYNKIKSILESFDLNKTSPIQALNLLVKLKEEI